MATPSSRAEYISALSRRLESLLPNRSGYGLAEVELNAQFILTTNLFFSIAKPSKKHNHTEYISDIIESLVLILERLNVDPTTRKLNDRDQNVLIATLVVLRLLSALVRQNWDSLLNFESNEPLVLGLGINFSYSLGYEDNCFDLYARPVPASLNIDTHHILEILMTLISPQLNKVSLASLRGQPFPNLEAADFSIDGTVDLNEKETVDHIDEIDNRISVVLRYIAAANPDDYYLFTQRKLFSWLERCEYIPSAALQKYAISIKYFYWTEKNAKEFLKYIHRAIPLVRSTSWKMLFLLYESMNLEYQCVYRPGFYEEFIHSGDHQQTFRLLFDHAVAVFEDHNALPPGLFTCLVMTCPADFDEFLLKPNRLKQAFNKRIKYLSTVVKEAQACAGLDNFESLVDIFFLGGKLPNIEGGVRQFSLTYIDSIFDNFLNMELRCVVESARIRHRCLFTRFVVAGILLKPTRFHRLYVDMLRDELSQPGECSETSCRCLRVLHLVRVLRDVADDDISRSELMVNDLHQILRNIMGHTTGRLEAYEETTGAQGNRAASEATNPSLTSQKSAVSSPLAHNLRRGLEFKFAYNLDNHSPVIAETQHETKPKMFLPPLPPSKTVPKMCAQVCEELLTYLLQIFALFPDYYIFPPTDIREKDVWEDKSIAQGVDSLRESVIRPIRVAILFKSLHSNTKLFDAGCNMAMAFVSSSRLPQLSKRRVFVNYLLSDTIVKTIAEACTVFSLADLKFKECFIFFNRFLQERDRVFGGNLVDEFIRVPRLHDFCNEVCEAVEIVLLLALCTHDVQFFNLARITMEWHVKEVQAAVHLPTCFKSALTDTLVKILEDDSVFTGFVSLHKRFRSIIMSAKPTNSLWRVWILIYQRWDDIVRSESYYDNESLIFRHYTGFLVSCSGCFLTPKFTQDPERSKEKPIEKITRFFEKAIELLKLSELVVRVVVKDAFSNESHSAIYQLVCNKLMNVGIDYMDHNDYSEEAVLFIEQLMAIITAMEGVKNDGSFVLVALLPNVCEFLIDFMNSVPKRTDHVKLKLRFCKLARAIEGDRSHYGLMGSFKSRNYFAKATLEWLEEAVFWNPNSTDNAASSDEITSNLLSHLSLAKSSEIEHLYLELAVESSKALEAQLKDNFLEIPDGTKKESIRQSKDLLFSNYFSVFYKILQKYTAPNQSQLMARSKYKVQTVVENVLKSISNIFHTDPDIGMHFILPLGYHENSKIRSIFLKIFATMIKSRKHKATGEIFTEEVISRMGELYEIVGAAAAVATASEHNLLATSLLGLCSYTGTLDRLFHVLLRDEISSVSRPSEIFRRNSTLTRLMSLFAKEYGDSYLNVVIRPFIEEMIEKNLVFEVEKAGPDDVDVFVSSLSKLVRSITSSDDAMPETFKLISLEIEACVGAKFPEASLVAVGSFIFLRFFCPAIVSPELVFGMTYIDSKVKRSLMQLVKVLQYMANGTLASLKWQTLQDRMPELTQLSDLIFDFLNRVAHANLVEKYPFRRTYVKPLPNLRYLHKFFHMYADRIKHQFIINDPLMNADKLKEKIHIWKCVDEILFTLGAAKPYVSLTGGTFYKAVENASNVGNALYNEFMAKMSARNFETSLDTRAIRSAVHDDGTPIVVVNIRYLSELDYDMSLLVFVMFESASRVWDNRFYIVMDFSQFYYMGMIGETYVSLMKMYSPAIFFKNCARTYYFNLPRVQYLHQVEDMIELRTQSNIDNEIYFLSQADEAADIKALRLEESIIAIAHDTRVIFKNCKLYDEGLQKFVPVTLKLGRQWMQICMERVTFKNHPSIKTPSVVPVETFMLTEISMCDISNRTMEPNEFTLTLNRYEYSVTLASSQRLEVLRFLYFAMLRNSKQTEDLLEIDEAEDENSKWFGKICNIVFLALLEEDPDIRGAAASLFTALSSYVDINFGIGSANSKRETFPADTTSFVSSVSGHFSKCLPDMTAGFLSAFFDNWGRLPEKLKVSGLMYMSPWLANVTQHILLKRDGNVKTSEIVRHLCRISAQNCSLLPFLQEIAWNQLFDEARLSAVLMDEIIAFVIEKKDDDSNWEDLVSVINPSSAVCGEVVSRLIKRIKDAEENDLEIALQSKLLEIGVLIRVCSSLFFNSYVYLSLFLADVFFFCTLFIDSSDFEYGTDLQLMVINTVQSFSHKVDLTLEQAEVIDNTVKYFSGQRARMLFGLTTKERGNLDYSQSYNRAMAFDLLCVHLNDFIVKMGTPSNRSRWIGRWSELSMDVAYGQSLFKLRAVMVVSSLAKFGINDSTAGKVLRLIGTISSKDPEGMTQGAVCFSRLET